MTALRRLAYAALVGALAQIVFGAIVRISGSGYGCGDHWPDCNGAWLPPLTGSAVAIEVTHRAGALVVLLAALALVGVAWMRRREPGVSGPGGVLRAAAFAVALVAAAAIFGWITVTQALDPLVIVTHKAIAISLLAAFAGATVRAGGLGAAAARDGAISAKTFRGARAAAALVFVVVVFGGLTANLPGANTACQGFPLCSAGSGGSAAHIQLAHRVLAYLLALHLLGLLIATTKRRETALARHLAQLCFTLVGVQIVIAVLLVELHLPGLLRSLHQATGVLVWLATFVFAYLGRWATATPRVAGPGRAAATPDGSDADRGGPVARAGIGRAGTA